jgi:uncharacterized membrane protein YfhO
MDLWGQYFPMYTEQYNNRRDLSPSFFSWNGALGFNLFAQTAYYGNSILNYILVFFNRNDLVKVFDYIILLKFGLASLTASIYFKNKFNKITLLTVSCSIAYSLCSYMLAFITQPMWLDAVILLPIVILGLEKLILYRKPFIYCISLAVTIYSNFYISFSICLFVVLYFIVFITSNSETIKLKEVKYSIANFCFFSIIAGGLVAFTILPVFKSIGLTIASGSTIPEHAEFYNHSIIEYISKLFPFTKTSLAYGVPNIYSGAFIFIMLPLFLINNKIRVRKKFIYSALFIFLYLSMNLNILDYIWHGLHFTNQLPGRWTFIFSFFVILISYETLTNIKGIDYKGVLFAFFHSILFICLTNYLPENINVNNIVKIMLLGMILYALLLFITIIFKKSIVGKISILAISILMIIETGVNTINVMDRDVSVSNIATYNHANDLMKEAVSSLKSDNNNFYRMEMAEGWTFNPGQLYDYKGISYYSSTMSGRAYNFFNGLGYRVYAKNISTIFNCHSPIMNSFFSIKYIIDKNKNFESAGMININTSEKYNIFENNYCLPIAFMVDKSLVNWKINNSSKPMDAQNSFLNSAMGRDVNVYEQIPYSGFSCTNANLTYNNDWNQQYYNKIDFNIPVEFKFNYHIQKEQYLYMQNGFKRGDLTVTINDNTKKTDIGVEPFKMIGHVKPGDNVEVIIKTTDVNMGLWGMDLFTINEEKFSECYKELNNNSAQIIKATDTKVKFRINSDGKKLLYTSIPDDGGWTVKCNGEKPDTYRIGDYLIAVAIPEGENTVSFSYHVPGLGLGIIISLICLIIFIIYILIKNNKIKTNLKILNLITSKKSK